MRKFFENLLVGVKQADEIIRSQRGTMSIDQVVKLLEKIRANTGTGAADGVELSEAISAVAALRRQLFNAKLSADDAHLSRIAAEEERELLRGQLLVMQSWKEITRETIDSMRAMVCGIGVVGKVDGMEVIKRLNAIDIIDRHRRMIEDALAGQPASEPHDPDLDPDGNLAGPDFGDGPEFEGWEQRSAAPKPQDDVLDAKRYRWIRGIYSPSAIRETDTGVKYHDLLWSSPLVNSMGDPASLDYWIDSTMQLEPKTGGTT